jgi:hypothetical protein
VLTVDRRGKFGDETDPAAKGGSFSLPEMP